jgi:ribosomal protein S18 acetylase RimI-like enzyme
MDITFKILTDDNRGNYQNIIVDYFKNKVVISEPENRAKQAICIALSKGEVVGVSTTYKQYNSLLREHFYYYRSSVSPDVRQQSISRELIKNVLESFNQQYQLGDPVGLFFEVENKMIMKSLTSPIWKSGAVFIGYDEWNRQQRVIYFNNAELGHSQPTA